MNIGLIDMDKKPRGKLFPNLALMKISAYHKSLGNSVEWYDALSNNKKDIIYISKIFTYKEDYAYPLYANKVIRGGTGYYINRTLPKVIDRQYPDYSLYPEVDYAIGFLTRGCINKCSFCVVPKKEGAIRPYSSWDRIKRPDSNEIVFMDNNVLASEYGIRQMQSMIGKDLVIDFNQGMDCMLVNDRIAEIISRLHWKRQIRFSCDKEYQMPYLEKAINLLAKYGVKPYRIFVYVLGTTMESTIKRVEFLRQLGVDPFVQPLRDLKTNAEPQKEMKRYANYVNKKAEFNSYKWEDCGKHKGTKTDPKQLNFMEEISNVESRPSTSEC